MRPAQKAPENVERTNPSVRNPRRFNEAGAKSAGKPLATLIDRPLVERASMRPAQKAPENDQSGEDPDRFLSMLQ